MFYYKTSYQFPPPTTTTIILPTHTIQPLPAHNQLPVTTLEFLLVGQTTPFKICAREVFVAFLCLAWRALACPDGQLQVNVVCDWERACPGPVGIFGVWMGNTTAQPTVLGDYAAFGICEASVTACLSGGYRNSCRNELWATATVGTISICESQGQTKRSTCHLGVDLQTEQHTCTIRFRTLSAYDIRKQLYRFLPCREIFEQVDCECISDAPRAQQDMCGVSRRRDTLPSRDSNNKTGQTGQAACQNCSLGTTALSPGSSRMSKKVHKRCVAMNSAPLEHTTANTGQTALMACHECPAGTFTKDHSPVGRVHRIPDCPLLYRRKLLS